MQPELHREREFAVDLSELEDDEPAHYPRYRRLALTQTREINRLTHLIGAQPRQIGIGVRKDLLGIAA